MARPVTTLVIFFFAFNLFAGMLLTTGVAGTLGVDANVGEDQEFNETKNDAKDVSTGTSTGSTLFGMYNVLSSQLGKNGIFGTIFPGLRMLRRAGVPAFITEGFLGPLFSVMMAIGMISFLRGWDL